jgi:hypothetical protein
VNCWIDRITFDEAENAGRQMIEKHGWWAGKLDQAREVEVGEYDEHTPGREYFEQALIDGEALVFHTWPKGAED